MEEKERDSLKIKLFFMGLVVMLIFSLLTTRLWKLQISKGSEYVAEAKGNTLRYVSIPSPRGDILDSKGKVLATSVPQFAITLDWLDLQNAREGGDPKLVVKGLAHYLQPYWGDGKVPESAIAEDIMANIQMHQFRKYEPVVVMEKIPLALQAILAEHQQELPGISVEARPYRTYPLGELAGHILGYVREVSEGELPNFQNKAAQAGLNKDNLYQAGDLVGKIGVENSYDLYLRGQDGLQLMEVDNKARPVDRLTRRNPVVGNSVQLTIDLDLQRVVDQKLTQVIDELKNSGKSKAGAGAAVVIEVKTGRILAMVSKPDINPNDLTGDISPDIFKRYFGTRDEGPRLGWSRAFQEVYAPGSTFKMITAMSALQDGKITPNDTIYDGLSSLRNPSAAVADWNSWSFNRVNLILGLSQSINYYFEALGERVMTDNPERIRQVAREFGLGAKAGLDIPGEVEGTAPSAAWKKALNGPRIDKLRDTRLQQLKTDTDAKLAQAKSDKERKQIQADSDRKKKQILDEYNKTYEWDAGWQAFDTYNTSIGQGDNKYTMLQMANYVATIVNGGHHMKPFLVDRVTDTTSGQSILNNKPTVLNEVDISPANLDAVKQAMREVLTPRGTGGDVFSGIPQFTGGGKTGTAQVGSKGTAEENDYNGTFVAFAPYDDPQIAFAGITEAGYHGGLSTGQVAAAAFQEYFKDKGWGAAPK